MLAASPFLQRSNGQQCGCFSSSSGPFFSPEDGPTTSFLKKEVGTATGYAVATVRPTNYDSSAARCRPLLDGANEGRRELEVDGDASPPPSDFFVALFAGGGAAPRRDNPPVTSTLSPFAYLGVGRERDDALVTLW